LFSIGVGIITTKNKQIYPKSQDKYSTSTIIVFLSIEPA